MKKPTFRKLALMAADRDDLQVISSLLQDAIATLGEFAWQKDQRTFAFVANRFVWENAAGEGGGPDLRVRTGVHFEDVSAVRAKNVRLGVSDAVVDILSVTYDGDEEGGTVTLTLAGGGEIALTVAAISANLRDLSDPWATKSRPDHETA